MTTDSNDATTLTPIPTEESKARTILRPSLANDSQQNKALQTIRPTNREPSVIEKDYAADAERCARSWLKDRIFPVDVRHPMNCFKFALGRVPEDIAGAFRLGGYAAWADIGQKIERALDTKRDEVEPPHGWEMGSHPRAQGKSGASSADEATRDMPAERPVSAHSPRPSFRRR
jgi:hypothetical protein